MYCLARNKSLVSILVFMTIFAVCTRSFGFGTVVESMELMDTMDEMDDKKYENRQSYDDIRAQRALAANAQNSPADVIKNITDRYVKMAETLNAHSRPAKEDIALNVAALRVPRSTLAGLDKNMQAKYFILMAWNEYFTDNITNAQKAAVRAFKTAPDIEDALVTMTSLSILAGEKAVLAPKKKTRPKAGNTYQNYNTSSQGTDLFDLDVKSIKTDMINPESPSKVTAMQLNCLNSTTFTYTPGSESLCIMFWQLSDKDVVSSEPNDPSGTPAKPLTASRPMPQPQNMQPQFYDEFGGDFGMMQGNMNPYGSNSAKKQDPTFLSNTEEFKQLFSSAFGIDNVRFVAINTDSLANKQAVVDKIMENPWPWAHVMAQDPKSQDTQFQGISVEHEKPLLLITSNDGTIKYAGPVVGLLTPLMFSKATGEDINASDVAVSVGGNPTVTGKTGVAKALMGLFARPKSGNNKPAAANPTVAAKRVSAQPKEMSMEDEYAASKLLENARAFITISRKITTPKNGIEMCREILAKYPNTKYSNEARMLLKKVPERYHKRYKLTNEELGL